MNLRGMALLLVVGAIAPASLAITLNPPALAQTQNFPTGDYLQDSLYVSIEGSSLSNLTILIQDLAGGEPISFQGATLSGTDARRIYTWEGDNRIYQVAWRPSDSEFIRLQIFTSSGQEIANHIMRVPD